MKTIEELTIAEKKGLAISILREELGFKWLLIAHIMELSESQVKRYYKRFETIYKPNK